MENSQSVKLFVGNLPLEISEEDLTHLFAPYGEILTCTLLRQFAFIHLQNSAAADRAIRELNGRDFRGRNLVVEESRARPLNSTKVFVGNLSAFCTAEDLQDLFRTFGNVLECDKVKAKLMSNAGYAFVHMERKEDALVAIEALHGTTFKGRQLSVELSKVQSSKPTTTGNVSTLGGYPAEAPMIKPSMEHHQSQAAVLAAAAAAAAGLPLTVQQSIHNSFYNTNSFDPTYAALKGLTSTSGSDGTPVSPAVYGALASQVYGSVASQVYADSLANQSYNGSTQTDQSGTSEATSNTGYTAVDPAAVFEAARARYFQQGQQVLAEQQAGSKSGDRDRSPIRRSTPLLPDPGPTTFSQPRPKRRALLPTPPGGPEEPSPVDGDPIARCYAEYYQQVQQYQQYQQYQQQYQQYQYGYPPAPAPAPAPTMPPVAMPTAVPLDTHVGAPRAYDLPPPHGEPLLHRYDYPHLHTPEPPYR